MSRMKKHKVKTEKPVASTSYSHEKEHDLAYYIHDRVELMHQVFSVLKHKELKAMAPDCVRHISIDDLKELCTEELLGISSKRLCAVLDGAAPPSDTESSSRSPSPPLETISLDSISSDDEILSQSSKKKKHKHRRRESKSRKKKSKEPEEEELEKSKASRAGLTVLELLELQARARAIRAQLQQEQVAVANTAPANPPRHSHSSDNEVEIKEEPPDVVEISSEEEKPDMKALDAHTESQEARQMVQQPPADGKTVTKRINDLIITVPQAKPSRKIKLKRTKAPAPVIIENVETKPVEETKKKKKKKEKKKKIDKEGSDNDEITLQLSDSEKMDVLGSLEQKNFEAGSTEDSESSSDSSEEEKSKKDKSSTNKDKSNKHDSTVKGKGTFQKVSNITVTTEVNPQIMPITEKDEESNAITISEEDSNTQEAIDKVSDYAKSNKKVDSEVTKEPGVDKEIVETTNVSRVEHIPLIEDTQTGSDKAVSEVNIVSSQEDISTGSTKMSADMELSEGELSDRDSSEVEAYEPTLEVVCISDDETGKKKKKKKDKKAKKEKKSKKKDFCDAADQNFYTDKNEEVVKDVEEDNEKEVVIDSDEDNRVNTDDACVILELSDDSSCYEVEGTVLSKEPTAEEIEALSAKMDEIEREEVVTDEQIREHERMLREKEQNKEIENVSWKDRYLDSRKVKRVLSTSNILNAIRKKNKELKKKLEESKFKEEREMDNRIDKVTEGELEEGSIEHYNTLQGSTKFVDPVKEKEVEEAEKKEDGKLTKEMKKDAKQLLKMYKKLLKYNDMHRQKDPNKKKKKKKKSKSKNSEEVTPV